MSEDERPDPGPRSYAGGPVGVLLIHGYTGAPPEMLRLAEYLHARGLTVAVPLLPGHGTTPEDLNRVRWQEWVDHLEAALWALQGRCAQVFVGGLSLGSLLALYLAAHHPELAGAMAYAPALKIQDRRQCLVPVLKYLIRQVPKSERHKDDPEVRASTWSYDVQPTYGAHEVLKVRRRVARLLPQVTCPLLIIHSTGDDQIGPDSAQRVYAQVGSRLKYIVTLHRSGHVITVDRDWEHVAASTYAFIRDRAPEPVAAAARTP